MSDSTYSDLAELIENLPLLIREARRARGLSQREATRQMGVDNTLVFRLENGAHVNSGVLPAIFRWLDISGQRAGSVRAPTDQGAEMNEFTAAIDPESPPDAQVGNRQTTQEQR
jgi:ribosome-binding protein aMBF1 (putative translation factor)